MVRAQALFVDRQSPVKQRPRGGHLDHIHIQIPQAAEDARHPRIFRSERLFVNRQRPPVEGLRFRVLALILLEHRQAAQSERH